MATKLLIVDLQSSSSRVKGEWVISLDLEVDGHPVNGDSEDLDKGGDGLFNGVSKIVHEEKQKFSN